MADKIVAEYTVKVDQALKDLNKLAARVDKVDDERKKVQDGFKDMSKGMAADFKKVGAAIGLAFGVDQLVSFGKEAVKVAAQAEGIRTAFARLNQPNLLNELRKATRGAVDDITLMRQAIRAQNFKVPLEQLGTFFEFATKRSIQTGESVDYLVNSIIDGIGRKSTLVLDNLGISATELQEEMKITGDFGAAAGAIIARELEKAGDVADTTAIKLAKINTALDNIKVVAGEALINFGTGLLYLAGQIDTGIEATDGLSQAAKNLSEIYENDVVGAVDKMIQKNQELLANNLRIEELKEKVSYQNSLQAIKVINEEIDKIEERNVFLREYIKELKKIYDASQKQDPVEKEQIKNLAYYNQLIKDLQAEQADANTTRERVRQLEDEINEAVRQRNLLLGKLSKEQKEQIELEERLRKIREISWTQMSSIGYPVTRSLTDTLAGLNRLLKEQQQILNNAPEFSKQYNDAANSIDRLNKKIKEFSDSQIDPNEGFPEFAPGGEMSATGQGLLPDPKTLEIRLNESLDLFRGFASSVQSIYASIAQMQQNAFIRQEQELQRQLEKGLITREQYETELDKIRQKQAAANKDAAIFQATISTAQAVVAALGSIPFSPANIALAATIGAAGAAQIAAIASQPLPQFAEGGFVMEHGEIKGRSHKHGGVHIEAEGGEFITSAKHAKQNADILKAINSGQWEKYKMENIIAPAINQVLEGGFENMGASYMLNTNWTDKNLLKQGDRNRYAMRDGFMYLGNKIEKLQSKRNRWN